MLGIKRGMVQIADENIAQLWAVNFPKRHESERSKTVCVTIYYIVTGRANKIIPSGSWSDKLHYALGYFKLSKDEFYELAKETEDAFL